MHVPVDELHYLTTRTLECGAVADVWTSKIAGVAEDTAIVTDVYFVNGSDGTASLNKVVTYNYAATTNDVPPPSTLFIDAMRENPTIASSWTKLNVAPCLETTSDGKCCSGH